MPFVFTVHNFIQAYISKSMISWYKQIYEAFTYINTPFIMAGNICFPNYTNWGPRNITYSNVQSSALYHISLQIMLFKNHYIVHSAFKKN